MQVIMQFKRKYTSASKILFETQEKEETYWTSYRVFRSTNSTNLLLHEDLRLIKITYSSINFNSSKIFKERIKNC